MNLGAGRFWKRLANSLSSKIKYQTIVLQNENPNGSKSLHAQAYDHEGGGGCDQRGVRPFGPGPSGPALWAHTRAGRRVMNTGEADEHSRK